MGEWLGELRALRGASLGGRLGSHLRFRIEAISESGQMDSHLHTSIVLSK